MQHCSNLKQRIENLTERDRKIILENFIVIVFSTIGLIVLRYRSFYMFHTASELFNAAISIGIFIVGTSTYKITKNEFFMFLGVGYLFVCMLDMFHTFSYEEMNIIPNASEKLVSQFWIAARIVELGTIILSAALVYKKTVKLNHFIVYFIFTSVFISFIYMIIYTEIPPIFVIEGKGITKIKVISEYIISFGFILSIVIFYKARNCMDHCLFIYIENSLILKVITEFFFTWYLCANDPYFVVGHIFKVLSFYCMYKGIIVNGIQRPYDMLLYNLDRVGSTLKENEKQRKFMEETIIKNEKCYDMVINNSGDAIVIMIEGKLVYANMTAAMMLGGSKISDIIGRNICDFVDRKSFSLKKLYGEALKSNNRYNFTELTIKSLDGTMLYVEGSLDNIVYRRKHALFIVLYNIKQHQEIRLLKNNVIESEKKLNESNEHNKALMEFFSNMSHELKTPLNIILGSLQLLQSTDGFNGFSCNDKGKKLMSIMKQNTYRLIRIVNNIIDTSKFDTGYLKLNMNNHNIVSIVEDITFSVIDYYTRNNGINIIFDTDTEEIIMAVDVDKIERIMLNLLSNAIKFTDSGGTIYVNMKHEGEYVLISVKDTGIGIPEDKLEVIFDRFGQVDKTFTRNREGSGIGLSLVKALTEIHGGSIFVKSIVGKGSEFIVKLPVTVIEDEETDYTLSYESKVDKINVEFSDIYNNF